MIQTFSRARVVGVTIPQIADCDIRNIEQFIAYVARVSNPSNQTNTETSGKLLRYLVKNKHWSPFEMASVTMEINTTRDIGRQILRHRSFSFQEFSQRYAEANSLGMEYKEPRLQDVKNRQNSLTEGVTPGLAMWWGEAQKRVADVANEIFNEAISRGIAKEQARAVMPEGMTTTRMYMAGSIRSWIHYIQLRTELGTQKEHREVALACKEALIPLLPSLEEYL